ncbi:hypothetical protein ABEB36_000263 [Hypothenemus hampei]|uniref:Transposable element P transposase-like RNase H domain-containing protein n=1 Tax=Hypothenemus hampei TaxID=57062 RepID=A0ABD1FAN8_HYPHA
MLKLPSERTLREYQNSKIENRVVAILFDEIYLNAEIHYDVSADEFKGYSDDASSRDPIPAKTALVSMITWINKPWKQAVGYWFLGGSNDTQRTTNIILNSIDEINKTGLIVKAIITD